MHLIKQNQYYLAFHQPQAQKMLDRIKSKRSCLLDFEAFQFNRTNKAKFNCFSNLNDIPFIVALGIVQFNEDTNTFAKVKDIHINRFPRFFSQDDLIKKLEMMLDDIDHFIKENAIEQFIFMDGHLEQAFFAWANQNLNHDMETINEVLRHTVDLYSFFNNISQYVIIDYHLNAIKYLKRFYDDISITPDDEFSNQQTGITASHKYNNKQDFNVQEWNKIIAHNKKDILFGINLITYLQALTIIGDEQIINTI